MGHHRKLGIALIIIGGIMLAFLGIITILAFLGVIEAAIILYEMLVYGWIYIVLIIGVAAVSVGGTILCVKRDICSLDK